MSMYMVVRLDGRQNNKSHRYQCGPLCVTVYTHLDAGQVLQAPTAVHVVQAQLALPKPMHAIWSVLYHCGLRLVV